MSDGGNGSFLIPNLEKDDTLPAVVINTDVKNTTMPAPDETAIVGAPENAKDGNLIEKEWIHHLEKIVRTTKDNPHMRTEEIKKTQADYLRKRLNYGIAKEDEK